MAILDSSFQSLAITSFMLWRFLFLFLSSNSQIIFWGGGAKAVNESCNEGVIMWLHVLAVVVQVDGYFVVRHISNFSKAAQSAPYRLSTPVFKDQDKQHTGRFLQEGIFPYCSFQRKCLEWKRNWDWSNEGLLVETFMFGFWCVGLHCVHRLLLFVI